MMKEMTATMLTEPNFFRRTSERLTFDVPAALH